MTDSNILWRGHLCKLTARRFN